MAATRWGIVGSGAISNDFVSAIVSYDPAKHEIVAVAARKLENAQEFGKKFSIPTCYGSYEELSKDPRVEIVYVGTIQVSHEAVSEMMIKAGKHVLCEASLALNSKDTKRVLAMARQHNVFLMEGIWTCFFPAIIRMREELVQGSIGKPKMINVTLGYEMPPTGWKTEKELGGGTIPDFGAYCAMITRAVFKNAKLDRVEASGTLTDKGVDDFVAATLYFDEGEVAQIVVTMTITLDNAVTIYGSNGKFLKIPGPFWCPNELITPSETQTFSLPPAPSHPAMYSRAEGFVYELDAVRESLQKGELENPLVSHEDSLWIVEVRDEIRRQIGITYDADLE